MFAFANDVNWIWKVVWGVSRSGNEKAVGVVPEVIVLLPDESCDLELAQEVMVESKSTSRGISAPGTGPRPSANHMSFKYKSIGDSTGLLPLHFVDKL